MNLPTSKLYLPAQWNGLLIIGDHPYKADSLAAPFMFSHLSTLKGLFKHNEIEDIFMGAALANVLSFFPPNGYISAANGAQLNAEITEAKEMIMTLKPRAILMLGRQTARMLKNVSDLESERGAPSLFMGFLTIMTMHPKEIFRQYDLNILAIHDVKKMGRLFSSGWVEAKWDINYTPTFDEARRALMGFLADRAPLSVDIETDSNLRMTCIGLAKNSTTCITIPFKKPGGRWFDEREESIIWRLLAQVLETCPLIGHNSVHFDHYVLFKSHRILPNFIADTMFAHWECYCEMPKSLSFLNSLYLTNPYWKDVLRDARSGKTDYKQEFLYNAKDCIVTLQAAHEIKKEFADLPPASYEHYKFNIRISRAFQYMSLRGVRFDTAKRDSRLKDLLLEQAALGAQVDLDVGHTINVNSPKQVTKWLYEELRLPPRYKLVLDEETGEKENRETGDYLSLLYLSRQFPDIPGLSSAAALRKLNKRISSLRGIETRPDGYIGFGFNAVGTETGRASAYKPIDGKGVQAQNVDRRDRDLFLADAGGFLLKADLEGADSWTVAAQLVALGDDTMMNDLLGGVKPAQALTIASLFGAELITAPTATLATYKKEMKAFTEKEEIARGPGRTSYDAYKAVSHGCVTAGHEVLTKEGWIPIEQLKQGVEILTWEPNGSAVWDTPSVLTSFNYSGNLQSFEGEAYSLEVTHDHRMPYFDTRKKFIGAKQAWEMRTIQQAKLPIAGQVSGDLPNIDEVRLLAAFQADGTITVNNQIDFKLKKQRKVERIKSILSTLNLEYKEYLNADETVVIRTDSEFLLRQTKKLKASVLLWDSLALRVYLEESIHWDGNEKKIYTADKERADMLQTMSHLSGKHASISTKISGFGSLIYVVNLNDRNTTIVSHMKREKTAVLSVPVYCVTVNTSYFFFRRNGHIGVTGNSNYGMGSSTMHTNIFKKSDGELWVSIQDCAKGQDLYEKRYKKLKALREKMANILTSVGYLDAFSGNRRFFFGRRDNSTIRVMLAQLPQAHTTYATNLLFDRLYHWKRNREPSAPRQFILKPTNQVHDETVLSFAQYNLSAAREIFAAASENRMECWGVPFVIPFDANYGENWGQAKTSL